MNDLKKNFLYIALICFNCVAYLVDFLSAPYYLGIFAVLSVWLWMPISKEKRCKDCKWHAPWMHPASSRCGFHPCVPGTFSYYHRKWWKFFKPK